MSKTTEAMSQAESVAMQFDLHDSRTICRMFLDVCRRYDLGKLDQTEMVQACMLVADEAENLGLRDPLKDWEA
tara:strand:- start:517 stop:735 length:219 start_codon:yes stop_codon:yes gene_type:complete